MKVENQLKPKDTNVLLDRPADGKKQKRVVWQLRKRSNGRKSAYQAKQDNSPVLLEDAAASV